MKHKPIIWIFTPGGWSLAEFVPPWIPAQPLVLYFQSWGGEAKVWKKTATQFNWDFINCNCLPPMHVTILQCLTDCSGEDKVSQALGNGFPAKNLDISKQRFHQSSQNTLPHLSNLRFGGNSTQTELLILWYWAIEYQSCSMELEGRSRASETWILESSFSTENTISRLKNCPEGHEDLKPSANNTLIFKPLWHFCMTIF